MPSHGLPLLWGDDTVHHEWTTNLLELIKNSHLPDKAPLGISDFVPQFWTLDRDKKVIAWANLFCMMAKFESDWDPNDVYHEPPPLGVDSIGLLQLSYQDESSYGLTPHLTPGSNGGLKNPISNLKWAIEIADQIVKDGQPLSALNSAGRWRGLGRYWSVMRPTNSDGSPRHSYHVIRDTVSQIVF